MSMYELDCIIDYMKSPLTSKPPKVILNVERNASGMVPNESDMVSTPLRRKKNAAERDNFKVIDSIHQYCICISNYIYISAYDSHNVVMI